MALPGIARTVLNRPKVWPLLLRRGGTLGSCPVCGLSTLFYHEGPWVRDQYICLWCRSIPRWRALVTVLENRFPSWREWKIHESSPGGPTSEMFSRECPGYSSSHYWPDTPLGSLRMGVRCESVECLTFDDNSFDLVITQDVFEHVPRPEIAFREVARVLRPGGAHLFTVPLSPGRQTITRVRVTDDTTEHVLTPQYHDNPVDPGGSLVITDWGVDLAEIVTAACGLPTEIVRPVDRKRGIVGPYLEVCVTSKPRASPVAGSGRRHAP